MIDLPTQKDMVSPHHRRAVWALIAASVVFTGIIVAYFLRPQNSAIQSAKAPTAEELAGRSVPPANLTDVQMAKLKVLISKQVPPAQLTPAQLAKLKSLQGK